MAFSSITPLSPYTLVGATSGNYGAGGLVPTPNPGDQSKYLKGDGTWALAGSIQGSGSDEVFFLNDRTVNNSYSIPNNKNAMSAGPIEIANGVVVTVPTSGVWTIV